ncbi:MAG: NmrA family NAD(P)-binding protein [Planctomycetes bacterium]|nr:NmrA family NAD(P)-binding protein [Planctomycetota bacterium]
MSKPLILVTGATGKTGAPVVEQWRERGFPVRALARRRDERSRRLEALGAEVVIGNLLESKSVRLAMQDVKRVYFCYPPGDQLLDATAIMAAVARDAGVEALVNISQLPAREDAPSALSRHHWLSENIFDWADIGAVHIRPTFFAEMLFILGGKTIPLEGKLYLPYGSQRHAPVAAADIARVAVAILADPTLHVGERYVVTGPRNMTVAEMTELLSNELGRPVEYVDLPNEAWGQVLREQVGLPEFLVAHLQAVADDHKNGVFSAQTDVVERIGGRPAQSVEEFVRSHRDMFTGDADSTEPTWRSPGRVVEAAIRE